MAIEACTPCRRAAHVTRLALGCGQLRFGRALLGSSRHRDGGAGRPGGSRSLSTGDGPRDVSFLIGPGRSCRPRGRRMVPGESRASRLWNREWQVLRWNQERRALSPRGRVSLRSTRKRGQRTTQVNHTQTRKTREEHDATTRTDLRDGNAAQSRVLRLESS